MQLSQDSISQKTYLTFHQDKSAMQIAKDKCGMRWEIPIATTPTNDSAAIRRLCNHVYFETSQYLPKFVNVCERRPFKKMTLRY